MEIEMQILDCDYIMFGGKPLVRLFGKTREGEVVCALTSGIMPYFYVDAKNNDEAKAGIENDGKEFNARAETVEKILPIGFHKPKNILRIMARDPSTVPDIKKIATKYGAPYEADILFKYRYLVDNGFKGMTWVRVNGKPAHTSIVKCRAIDAEKIEPLEQSGIAGNAPLRYLSLDIESVSDSDDRIPEAEKDGIVIISLCFFPDYKSKRTLVLSAKPVRTGSEVIACSDEKEMLKKFTEIVNDYNPDVVIGYNINNFDLPFIVKRLETLNLPRDFGRTEKNVFCRKLQNGHVCSMVGRVVVDPYEIIKKDPWVKFKRYDLGTIAKAMLGEGKMEMGGIREMRGLWNGSQEQIKKFIDYSRVDAELAMRLVIEKGLLDKFSELAKISGLLLQDTLGGQSQRHECKLLHEFRKRNMVMPCRPGDSDVEKYEDEREDKGLKGAIVLEPIVGLHKNCSIIVLDFTSLYPSLIHTYNICPTTLLLENNDGLDHFTSPDGVKFVKHEIREGVLPAILSELMEARAATKKQLKTAATPEQKRLLDAKQLALKDMANSLYGYTGYMRARLYVMDVANSVTGYGRENIMKTKKIIEDTFHKTVTYGDSITRDRFVTIMNKNGIIEIKNIEELFEENKNKADFARGKEFINLEGCKALTLNSNTKKTEWMPIKQIIRHKAKKKIFRVNQKFGEAIVTEDHSIITENNGKLGETKPQDMGNKEMVRVRHIPKPKQTDCIDLYEILSPYKSKSIYKGREKISEVRVEDGWLIFGWNNRKNPVKVKRIIKVGSKEFESLCRLVGAYIPEGSSSTPETTKSRDGASIASSDVKWLEQLREDYKNIFINAEASIVKSTKNRRTLTYKNTAAQTKTIDYDDNTCKLQMMNRLSAVFFKMLCGQKSYGKKIPDFVYHIPKKYQMIILDNMIKGDGSRIFMNMKLPYSDKYKQNNFRYETRSLQLISGLSFLLSLLDQNYTIRFRPAKKTYILTTVTNNNFNTPTKITEEKYEGFVYDLSVEGSHMFVDSCGQILLHNTDSIFVKTDTTDLEEAEKEGIKISSFVTEELPGVLDLKFEKVYKTFLILTKKRYAGWKFEREGDKWKDKIEMKGIETVRRDWCSLTSETMLNVLNIILKEGDIQKAAKFVRAVIEDLSAGKIPLEKLTIIKGVSRALNSYKGVQPHVELAKKIGKRDPTKSVIVGERLGYVIVKGNQLVSKRAEDPDYVKEKGLEIDPQYYIENQMLPPIERIFEVCGVNKSELMEGSHQKKLFEMFGAKAAEVKSPELTVLKGFDSVVCKKCDWNFRRVPLAGKCPNCGSQLFFQKDGSIGASAEME